MAQQRAKKLFGNAVTVLCKRVGYSQKGLAEHMDADPSYVSKICAGEILPLKYLETISEYLRVPIQTLFAEDPLAGKSAPVDFKPPTPVEALQVLAAVAGLSVQVKRRAKSVKQN